MCDPTVAYFSVLAQVLISKEQRVGGVFNACRQEHVFSASAGTFNLRFEQGGKKNMTDINSSGAKNKKNKETTVGNLTGGDVQRLGINTGRKNSRELSKAVFATCVFTGRLWDTPC